MNPQLFDAQAALTFLVSQLSAIEAEVYQTRYPDYDFAALVPVDSSAPEWTPSVTFFSMDTVGQANWFTGYAFDMPYADVVRDKFTKGMFMAGIGYEYNIEEIGQARLIGQNLTDAKAAAARRAYAQFMYAVAVRGNTEKNLGGIVNDSTVTSGNVANDGTGSSRLWTAKTPALIVRDINDLLQGIYVDTATVEMANTLLLPITAFNYIASLAYATGSNETVLSFIQKNNVYTITTGQPLLIRAIRGLENDGAAGVGRMVAYMRDPSVLKLHLPMPHRFLPVWQNGPMNYVIPGIFRTGGVEVRRPGAMRYADGIVA